MKSHTGLVFPALFQLSLWEHTAAVTFPAFFFLLLAVVVPFLKFSKFSAFRASVSGLGPGSGGFSGFVPDGLMPISLIACCHFGNSLKFFRENIGSHRLGP